MFTKKKNNNIGFLCTEGNYIENINNDYSEVVIQLKDTIEMNNSLAREINHVRFSSNRDSENIKCSLISKVSSHLLKAQENIARISKASEDCTDIVSIQEGIKMVLKELDKSIEEMNLVKIHCIGFPFDPMKQEIGGMTSVEEFENNIVVETLRHGYEFDGKVIRPALVVVNQKRTQSSSQKTDNDGNNSNIEKDTQ
jgi:molecular chaperone GrpE